MESNLREHLSTYLDYQQDAILGEFASALKSKFENSLVTIIFYGSCRRSKQYADAMLDFYVIVNNYEDAYKKYWYKLANKLLPPNVFYLEVEVDKQTYRAKYAVISQQHLTNRVSSSSFHSYFWARFTQPLSYIYDDSENIKEWVVDIQSSAAKTFSNKVIPVISQTFSSKQFWVRGLQLTYAAELRAEGKDRAEKIYKDNQAFYDGIYDSLKMSNLKRSTQQPYIFNKLAWKIRIIYGKFLSVLRLMKATTTFINGADYITWKIERHTGESIQLSEKQRKYPFLFAWPVIIRLYLQGRFH